MLQMSTEMKSNNNKRTNCNQMLLSIFEFKLFMCKIIIIILKPLSHFCTA